MQDREHQALVRQRFAEIGAGRITDDKTVLDVCPGGGKSKNVLIAASELHKAGMAGGLIWLVPRASLASQSRRGFNSGAKSLDVPDYFKLGSIGPQLRNLWGYVDTYQKFISMRADIYAKGVADRMKGRPGIVLLVLDELHHCSEDLEQAWSAGVDKLRCTLLNHGVNLHVINMTGTLFRGDGRPILYVDYEGNKAITHIRYGLTKGREEKAVVPPEMVYMDGPVVIRSATGNEKGYQSMTEVPPSHRSKVRKAFTCGSLPKHTFHPDLKDSRQFTSLYLIRYGIEHYIEKRKEYDYPLQAIVVAGSASSAMGYTSWLRQNYPELRVGVSLADNGANSAGNKGFSHIKFPEMTLVKFDGSEVPVEKLISVNGATSEDASCWIEDFQLITNGMPVNNYGRHKQKFKASMSFSEHEAFDQMPLGEKVIQCFQADPIDGENVIDVLVTVGKAYEGLDAPRCKHLICLTRQRSAPWLAQCFARAWRRDYGLQAKGFTDQRCWIFAPRDQEMLDAVDRIVWDQELVTPNQPKLPDPEVPEQAPEAVLTEEQRQSYEQFTAEMKAAIQAQLEEEMAAEQAAEADEVEFPTDEAGEWADSSSGGDDAADESGSEPPKQKAKAFSVVDRIIHEFVDDSIHAMAVLKDEKVTAEQMLAA